MADSFSSDDEYRSFPHLNLADISAESIRYLHSGLARKFFLSCKVDEIPYIFGLDELSIIITKHLIEKSFKLREVGELK